MDSNAKMEKIALCLALCVYAASGAPWCPQGFVGYGNSCYYLVASRLNWFDADQFCTYLRPKEYSMHLVTVEDSAEQAFLLNEIKKDGVIRERDVWLGASQIDKKRGWRWAPTQKSLSYSYWASGEPGYGKCAYLSWWSKYKWVNTDCHSAKSFICEYNTVHGLPVSPIWPRTTTPRYRTSTRRPARCPEGFVPFGRSCYYFVPTSLNWFDADQFCTMLVPQTYNVHLVSVESREESDFLYNHLVNDKDLRKRQFWTSGNQLNKRGTWQWARNNRVMSYTNWAPREPNGSGYCVQLWYDKHYQWDDVECDSTPSRHGFICEVESA